MTINPLSQLLSAAVLLEQDGHPAHAGAVRVYVASVKRADALALDAPEAEEVVEVTLPDYIWPDPCSDGFIDAWNGWYPTEAEARQDALPGVGQPWVLRSGETVISDDEADERRAAFPLRAAVTRWRLQRSHHLDDRHRPHRDPARANRLLYELHVDFLDGSRTSATGLTLNDVIAFVGTFDNLTIVECSISPVEDGA